MGNCCKNDARMCEYHLDQRIKEIQNQQAVVDHDRAVAIKKIDAWHEKKWAALDREWDRLVAMRNELWAEEDARREADKIAKAGKAVARA